MGRVIGLAEKFFWAMVWLVVLLIGTVFLLHLLENKFSGNAIGNIASKIQSLAGLGA